MSTIDPIRYAAMLAADTSGDHGTAERIAAELATAERRGDAAARNRALLGAETAAQRSRGRVGRPRGPMGESS